MDLNNQPPLSTIQKNKRVLVLGEDTRSFLSTIRSFGRAGFSVDVGWVDHRSPAMASRYIADVVTIPVYQVEDTAWLQEINRLVRERDYQFVVACHDAQVLPLQHHRHALEQPDRFALLPDKAFEISFSKKLTYELAETLGIPVPEQCISHTQMGIEAIRQAWQSDIYLKPMRSTSIDHIEHRNAVVRVDLSSPAPLFDADTLQEGLLVQRAVLGKGVGVELLAKNGKILTAFQHERVHEPPIGGGSSYRRSVPLDPGMLEASAKLVKALDYTGVAMIEFKYDAKSHQWWLMEVNGRFWGSLPLTIAAGLDMPLYWYQMLKEGRTEFPQAYRKNIYCRAWFSDRYWIISNLRVRRTRKDRLSVPLFAVLAEIRQVFLGRERSDTFVLDDPKPAIEELKQIFIEPLDSFIRRFAFVKHRSRLRAEQALASAQSVLFVCFGNICRSPFAEAFARQEWGIAVASAGTYPHIGRPSPIEAIQAASTFSVDLKPHRSAMIDKQMVDAADVILVFDLKNERHILAEFPCARTKIHQLGCLDEGKTVIEDPYGKGVQAFEKTYARIGELVRHIDRLIKGNA